MKSKTFPWQRSCSACDRRRRVGAADTAAFDKAMAPDRRPVRNDPQGPGRRQRQGRGPGGEEDRPSWPRKLKAEQRQRQARRALQAAADEDQGRGDQAEQGQGHRKQREAFKELSRPLAMWATMSKPAGLNVVFCSMAKGSWLQRDKTDRQPVLRRQDAALRRGGERQAQGHRWRPHEALGQGTEALHRASGVLLFLQQIALAPVT